MNIIEHLTHRLQHLDQYRAAYQQILEFERALEETAPAPGFPFLTHPPRVDPPPAPNAVPDPAATLAAEVVDAPSGRVKVTYTLKGPVRNGKPPRGRRRTVPNYATQGRPGKLVGLMRALAPDLGEGFSSDQMRQAILKKFPEMKVNAVSVNLMDMANRGELSYEGAGRDRRYTWKGAARSRVAMEYEKFRETIPAPPAVR